MSERPAPYWIGNVAHVSFPALPFMIDGERVPYGNEPEQEEPRKAPTPITRGSPAKPNIEPSPGPLGYHR